MSRGNRLAGMVCGVVILMVGSAAVAAPDDTTYSLRAAYDLNGGPAEAHGLFDDAIVDTGTVFDATTVIIGDNDHDFVGLPSEIMHGLTDFTVTIRFRIDTMTAVNALIYVMDLAGGSPTQLAIRMVDGELRWNMGSVWRNTGVMLSAGVWYELETMRFDDTFWMYLNGEQIAEETGVDVAPLVVSDGTFGGVALTGILLGQDPCTSCTPPFGVGASLAGVIDYVYIYDEAPVALEAVTFSHVKALFE